ncbi:MAG: radical SAM protein, partial [Bacillota bacterium]|nr:radical SAM protein [Bacillota bacterium]
NTDHVRTIVDSGLDTMRVSLFSAQEDNYNRYYRPRNYSLTDVERSIAYSVEQGVYVSLNLLAFPGFTDRKTEIEALLGLIHRTGLQKVQLRNLNIDCDYFYETLELEKEPSLGMEVLIHRLEENGVVVGNYSRPKNI